MKEKCNLNENNFIKYFIYVYCENTARSNGLDYMLLQYTGVYASTVIQAPWLTCWHINLPVSELQRVYFQIKRLMEKTEEWENLIIARLGVAQASDSPSDPPNIPLDNQTWIIGDIAGSEYILPIGAAKYRIKNLRGTLSRTPYSRLARFLCFYQWNWVASYLYFTIFMGGIQNVLCFHSSIDGNLAPIIGFQKMIH